MTEEKLTRLLNELGSPVDESADFEQVRQKATSKRRRRSWFRLAVDAAAILLVIALLYGGWRVVEPGRMRPLVDDNEATVSTGPATPTTGRDQSTSSTTGQPPETAAQLVERAKQALRDLGPVRVTVSETSQSTEGQGRPEFSGTTTIEQLIDQERHRGLQVTTHADRKVEKVSLDGIEQTNYSSSPVSYGKHIYAESPAGVSFPIAGDYEEALAGAQDAEMEALPDGGWRLSETRTPTEEPDSQGGERLPLTKVQYALEIGEDYLPRRMTMHMEGEGGLRADVEWTYTFEDIAPLTSEQVVIEPPENVVLGGTTYDLPFDNPRSEHADWGQYWLGEEVAGHTLRMAQHMVFEPDPSYEPRQEGINFIYDVPGDEDDNENIQLRVMSLTEGSAEHARSALANREPERRTLAGEPAEVYPGGTSYGLRDKYEIFFPDAYVVLQLWGVPEAVHEEVLNALRRVG